MTTDLRADSRRALWFAVFVLVAASVLFLFRTFLPSLTAMTHSYPAYYTASRLVIEGRWSAQLYDDKWFEARVLEITNGRVSERMSLNPPTTSLLLVPIAWLDLTTVRILWQFANLAFLAASVWLMLDALRIQEFLWRVLFGAFVLVYPPLLENFRVGQVYVLLLFLFALTLWSELRAKHFLAGVGLGIAAGLKLSGAPIWLVFAVRGQWRALAWATVVASASALLGLVVLGADGWFAFFKRVLDYSQPVPLAAHVAFQATPSLMQRMFVASSNFNPTPLFDAAWLASPINLLVCILALGLMLWFERRARFEIAYACAVTSSVILFPMAIEYHYTLLLIPIAVMARDLLEKRTRLEILWFAAILFLLCVPIDWNVSYWNERALTLFAYPRLYGGWLLWLWLLRRMWLQNAVNVRRALPSSATQ